MTDREEAIKGLEKVWDAFNHMEHELYADYVFDALALLKEQKSEWLEDSDPGQEYGTTWACRKCHHSIHKPFVWNPYDSKMDYCPTCGARMVVNMDE